VAQIGLIPSDSRLSAFSGKLTYFADEPVLMNTGISPKDIVRRKSLDDGRYDILKDQGISYVLINVAQTDPRGWSQALSENGFQRIYNNTSYILFQRIHSLLE
jgi:hypothetical protein